MFNKAPERDGSPVNGSRPAHPARDCERFGIRDRRGSRDHRQPRVCKGEVQIDGQVEGDIHAQRIVIGEHARRPPATLSQSR